ncbi:hypothetical protein CAEBREN_10670 [Caenorhabditis brenneri]|uniref:Uncharacterized protein n=1 Tax=Caenorhabditis brenneri TaxID=135651 RepID=G0PDB0_CAEBE|nr:hypothetical protein CAEBREN_10670 [Caenorhabditis brenneri]
MQKALALLLLLPSLVSAGTAAVSVRGRLMCNGQPFTNEKVELYEKNWVRQDSRMASIRTDNNGEFSMQGAIEEWPLFTPKPYIYIPNFCDIKNKLGYFECADSVQIYVPPVLIADGHLATKTFDIGEVEMMNLETERKGLGYFVYTFVHHKECRENHEEKKH